MRKDELKFRGMAIPNNMRTYENLPSHGSFFKYYYLYKTIKKLEGKNYLYDLRKYFKKYCDRYYEKNEKKIKEMWHERFGTATD